MIMHSLTNKFLQNGQEQTERFRVWVNTSGEHGSSPDILNGPSQVGRTIVIPLAPGEAGVRIPRSLKTKELWALIEACLGQAEKILSLQ